MRTGADDARVEYREVLLAGGEGGDGEGAAGLGAATHPPLRRRTGTLSSWTRRKKKNISRSCLFFLTSLAVLVHIPGSSKDNRRCTVTLLFNAIPPSHPTRGHNKTGCSCYEWVRLPYREENKTNIFEK